MALQRTCLVQPPLSMSSHFFLEQHHKLLSLRKNHQGFHLNLPIAHNCRSKHCLVLQIIMHKNMMQKNSNVVRTNGCFVNHFSNFCKTPGDCLAQFSTSLKCALKSNPMERNSSTIFIHIIIIPSLIMSNNFSKYATTYTEPSRRIKNLL